MDSPFRAVALGLVIFGLVSNAFGQVQVRTIGGGRTSPTGPDAGYVDGNSIQSSQFNYPAGAVVDRAGALFIADRNNGAVRKLDVAGNRASTFLAGLNQPVALAVDGTNNLYVLTQGDGLIRRIDRFGNVATNQVRLLSPTAMTFHTNGSFYVAESGGALVRVSPTDGTKLVLRSDLNRPNGVTTLESGLLAVSDTGNHRILLLNSDNAAIVQQVGTGRAGFRDGSLADAQFNQPHQLARAPDGTVVVADRMNHRVRLIRPDGAVVTLYGINPASWEGPECLNCNPIILPGWFDNTAEFAEACEPVGVAVNPDGNVFTTEVYYHLVREVTGAGLAGGGTSGASTNLVVLPPILTPHSGYFPLGQDITVVNPNTNAFFENAIYYTTDATDPTTNSFRLALSNGVGMIRWRETTRDLTSLRAVALLGNRASEVVHGQPAAANELGVTREVAAGVGSTVVVPIAVNLRPTDQLKSLQFRVEIRPKSVGAPLISEAFRVLPVSTNDFIPIATPSLNGGPTTFNVAAYTDGPVRGLAVTFIGQNANFAVKNFGVVAMLAVPVPTTARMGDRYTLSVVNPTGTSDGAEASIPLAAMPSRDIVAAETAYWVGDSSPANWYNADQSTTTLDTALLASRREYGAYGFGDRLLENRDVNNAFFASLGVRVPYPFTDLFDAMDAYPEDMSNAVGGDGLIRFLDWQIILRRSLKLDSTVWIRYWATNGVRSVERLTPVFLPNSRGAILKRALSPKYWFCQASVSAVPQENVQPGVVTDIPVYLEVSPGYQVAGMAFRATLYSDSGAPPLQQPLQFVTAPGLPKPIQSIGVSPNDLLCGWPLVQNYSFDPPLRDKILLGSIRFSLPNTAQAGQTYTLHFTNADGSPDLHTQYDFETRPASIWVQTAALRKPERISDEWKIYFFGSLTNQSAQPDADPDHDGMSNLDEYLAGTNPTSAASALRLEVPHTDAASPRIVLRWLSAPGRTYTLETSASLVQPDWKAIASDLPGTGATQEVIHTNTATGSQYYRLRLQLPDTSR